MSGRDNTPEGQCQSLPDRLEVEFIRNPLMATVKLARFKFPARLLGRKDRVLDLGCGTGYGAYYYATMTEGEVVGVDGFADLDFARRQFGRDNLSFVQGDLRALPGETAARKFDVVVSIDVIEHFSKSEATAIIGQVRKLLAPAGMLILGTPNALSGAYRSAQSRSVHVHEFEPDELREICDRQFRRTLMFSMNDEVVHTGFSKMAWFFYVLCIA